MLGTTLRTYQSPTRLVQGLGAIGELGREAEALGVRRPLVVSALRAIHHEIPVE